jgi:hypothetical protein
MKWASLLEVLCTWFADYAYKYNFVDTQDETMTTKAETSVSAVMTQLNLKMISVQNVETTP